MSRIKNKNTKPEIVLRKALWAKGLRFKLHQANLPGKPDLVIHKYRLAIFVDGGFWHGFQWEVKKLKINSNKSFWIDKIESNMRRDFQNNQRLEAAGFTVMRFWDHDILKKLTWCINQVLLYVEAMRDGQVPDKTQFETIN